MAELLTQGTYTSTNFWDFSYPYRIIIVKTYDARIYLEEISRLGLMSTYLIFEWPIRVIILPILTYTDSHLWHMTPYWPLDNLQRQDISNQFIWGLLSTHVREVGRNDDVQQYHFPFLCDVYY